MKTSWLLLTCLACLSMGCTDRVGPAPAPPQYSATEGGGPAWAPAAPPSLNESPNRAAAPAAAPAPGTSPAPVPAPGATPVAPAAQPASADLTKKGIAGKEMGKGVLATPASMYMRIPDKVVFLNIHNTMNLYKGTNGALPKTHDDFMREIINANGIKLPELGDGQRYQYVPEGEELMIVRDPK